MIKLKCLNCGVEWGDPEASDMDISHGYCPQCLRGYYTERIRRAQLRSGYSDCFNRRYNDCTELFCRFRCACQDYLVEEWEKGVING
ncbi:MAG: hypothetical protein V2B18_19020, partial [Pseudomonadota bacterium]